MQKSKEINLKLLSCLYQSEPYVEFCIIFHIFAAGLKPQSRRTKTAKSL